MITFKYNHKQFPEIVTFLFEKFGKPVEDVSWFWHSIDDGFNYVRIYNDTPDATFAMLKWGV